MNSNNTEHDDNDLIDDLRFIRADPVVDRASIVQINIEYMEWVASGIEAVCGISMLVISGQSIADYVENAIDKVCSEKPPRGVFYLVYKNAELVGMVGLRSLREGVAEIKRLYVRETFRGQHLGEQFLRKVMTDAKIFGYLQVRLDTAPFMVAAQRLYQSLGFVDRSPYDGTEVPEVLHSQWRFMELDLQCVVS